MRNVWKLFTILAVLGLGFTTLPAQAGVQKVIFDDEFGYPT